MLQRRNNDGSTAWPFEARRLAHHLATILDAPLLLPLSQLFVIIAVLAWAMTFAGLVDSCLNRALHTQSSN
jgi:hypothetical protein